MRVIKVVDLISTYLVVPANDNLLVAQSVCKEVIKLSSEMLKCHITNVFLFQAFNWDSGHAGAMNYMLECNVLLVSKNLHASNIHIWNKHLIIYIQQLIQRFDCWAQSDLHWELHLRQQNFRAQQFHPVCQCHFWLLWQQHHSCWLWGSGNYYRRILVKVLAHGCNKTIINLNDEFKGKYLRGNVLEICVMLVVLLERAIQFFIGLGIVIPGNTLLKDVAENMLMGVDLQSIPIFCRIVQAIILCTHSNSAPPELFNSCWEIMLLLQQVLQNVITLGILFLGLTLSEGWGTCSE